jgi:hypothetical protein
MAWRLEGGTNFRWVRIRSPRGYGPEWLALKLGAIPVGTVSKALVATQGHRWRCELPGLPKGTQTQGTHPVESECRARLIAATRNWLTLAGLEEMPQTATADD